MKQVGFIIFLVWAVSLPLSAIKVTINDIRYEVDTISRTAEIEKVLDSYSSYSGDIIIPSTITVEGADCSVISIAANAFYGCSATGITLPNSISKIGRAAFKECEKLTTIILPERLDSICAETFYNCFILKNVLIPENVKSIGDYAFCNCVELSLNIPSSLEKIGIGAFSNCHAIEDIIIPEGVTVIPHYAFYWCASLKSVILPEGLKEIGTSAFFGCKNLGNLNIPEDVTIIGPGAFIGCSSFTEMKIPQKVTRIESNTFESCSNLNSISLPDNIRSIGIEAFRRCKALKTIDMSNNIEYIGTDAFNDTPWYQNQSDGLLYIGRVAYKYLGEMPPQTIIQIKEGTKSISSNAFENCTGLSEIHIPNSVFDIGDYCFSGCVNLSHFDTPDSLKSIGAFSFNSCKMLVKVNLPPQVSMIGPYAFANCYKLRSVNLPDSLPYIRQYAFLNCVSISSITIPEKVQYISSSAFENNTSLTTVYLPKNRLEWIYDNAFSGCKNLSDVYCPATVIPNLYSSAFSSTPIESATLHVPDTCVEAYRKADGWSGFGRIVSLLDKPYLTFVDGGKLWNTGIMADDEFLKQYEYRFYGDTIINGRRCMELIRSALMTRQYGGTQPIDTIYVGALYEKDQKVYCAFPGQQEFELLYDFASPVGSDVEIRGEQFTIVRKEMSQEPGFKGNCTYLQLKGQTDAPLLCWMEGIGNLSNPLAPLFYRHSTDSQDEVLQFCSILPDEIIYLRDESLPSNIEVKKQWLDFTHTTKPRPKSPKKNEGPTPTLPVGARDETDGEENLTGEYSAKELFVNMNSLSGTYNVALTDAIGNEVYRKEVQTNNIVALNTDLTKYAEGTYTLTVENAAELYTATLSLPLVDDAVRDRPSSLTLQPSSLPTWTDLSGRRLTTPPTQKGVYIRDGRKILIK